MSMMSKNGFCKFAGTAIVAVFAALGCTSTYAAIETSKEQSACNDEKCPVSANVRGHENIEWSISYAYGLTDSTRGLPRVLLVGDSICNGYQGGVRERLKGKMNVTYWVSSYCVTSPAYLPLLSVYLDEAKYDVVHFNNGLHSLGTQTPAYENGMRRAFALIREKQPDAKIVWCTSTPLANDVKTAKCRELNAAAARVVAELGDIASDDLFALCDPLDRATNWSDEYHFRPEAKARQAEQVASFLSAVAGCARNSATVQPAADTFEAARIAMLNRSRKVIWNTDGNDMVLYPRALPLTAEAFESVRLKYTEGTKIDSVFYCPHSSAFGWFTTRKTHDFMTTQLRQPEADVYNAAADFAAKGMDALEMASAYCRRRGLEIFVSIRMNDTHDNRGSQPPGPHFSLFKQQHPECLMGTMTNCPRYCAWTAVDFTHEAVRAHVRRFVREFLENYDLDGIEYDFFRHLQLFKTVADGADATQSELDLMTDLMRNLRAIAEEAGRRRGKPFLVAARVPDSVGFCRTVGIDIERWVRESIVDIVIGAGYFQCNPWHVMSDVVHRNGGKFYASLDEARNAEKRAPLGLLPGRAKSPAFFRAREAAAMVEGVDGVYLFNLEQDALPPIARLDPRSPGGLPQDYFAVPRATAFSQLWHYCADSMRFLNMPRIEPQRPLKMFAGETYAFELVVGDEPAAYSPPRTVTVEVQTDAEAADALSLSVNGRCAERISFKKGVLTFAVPASLVRKGANNIALASARALRVADFALRILGSP